MKSIMAGKGTGNDFDTSAVDERKGINSVEVGLRVLEVLSSAGHSLPLKDISRLSGLSGSQSHRYLTNLIRGGLVTQDASTGHYRLGSMALRVGLSALPQIDALKVAEDALDRLVSRITETSMMAIWGERSPVTVRWHRGSTFIFLPVGVGSTFPLLNSATGRVFLGYLPRVVTNSLLEQELEEADLNEETVNMDDVIANVRAQGYSALEGHVLPGYCATCAPVFDSQGEIVAGITIMGMANHPKEIRRASTQTLLDMTRDASRSLGWSEK
ncbi:IclR family transcriptional regulator [Sulfitobacter sp. PR48]|nr:IclR family transcriptional regulator [Sulfitobacter sp. PR48]